MMIQTNQLNTDQLFALDDLIAACQKMDGNHIPVYKHLLSQGRNRPGTVLSYQHNKLIGFISVFFFYETACEIALLVRPENRSQGVASRLFKKILPLLQAERIKRIIFSSPHQEQQCWLYDKGFKLVNSEYEMRRQSRDSVHCRQIELSIRPAIMDDYPFFITIDAACFPDQPANVSDRFYALLNNPEYTIVVAQWDNQLIGKAHIHWQPDDARLSDIAVLPEFRNRGFGQTLIAHCINHVLKQKVNVVSLEVETRNQHALKLYKSLGFEAINSCDYFSISLICAEKFFSK